MAERPDESSAREALVAAARRLDDAGLNVNASGNLSVRIAGGVLVTPSGIPPRAMAAADGVVLGLDGVARHRGARTPTSEWRLHTEVYRRRPDVGAIVHTHSPEATAAAVLATPIPAVHYVVARFGATVLPCAPYATYGSPELADNVADVLDVGGMASLLANHGAIALGRDLDAAVALAIDVEWFCGVYRRARQIGEPTVLHDDEITHVAERFESYGQPPAG